MVGDLNGQFDIRNDGIATKNAMFIGDKKRYVYWLIYMDYCIFIFIMIIKLEDQNEILDFLMFSGSSTLQGSGVGLSSLTLGPVAVKDGSPPNRVAKFASAAMGIPFRMEVLDGFRRKSSTNG